MAGSQYLPGPRSYVWSQVAGCAHHLVLIKELLGFEHQVFLQGRGRKDSQAPENLSSSSPMIYHWPEYVTWPHSSIRNLFFCLSWHITNLNTINGKQLTILPHLENVLRMKKKRREERRECKDVKEERDVCRRKDEMDKEFKENWLGFDPAVITSMLFDWKQISVVEAVFPTVKCLSYKMAVRIRWNYLCNILRVVIA